MRRLAIGLGLILLAACASPVAGPAASPVPHPTASPPSPLSEVRLALIGDVPENNVWALFSGQDYSYNAYAVRSGYWPRLYTLSIPERQFVPLAAEGMPEPIQPAGELFTATISLRPDLLWSDGRPFTAEDVAFSVNTALAFRLGFDWRDAYNPDFLERAEAVDARHVVFYFKRPPNLTVWQYGALQGPIVQKAYWSPGVESAAALLPPPDLLTQIEALQARVSALQMQVSAAPNEDAPQARAALNQQESHLQEAQNRLAGAEAERDARYTAARQALFALDDAGEPRLGEWQPARREVDAIENIPHPSLLTSPPERVVYRLYPDLPAALRGLGSGEVNAILTPAGLSPQDMASLPAVKAMTSPSFHLRFLVFNATRADLMEPALHRALSCLIEPQTLSARLNGRALPLEAFILPEERLWYNPQAALPCRGMELAARRGEALQILASAGYTWDRVPEAQSDGAGLRLPSGEAVPSLTLLVPGEDDLRLAAAGYVQQQARWLGLALQVQPAAAEAVHYAVFSSHQYDLALLGWRVSASPMYLCAWFGDGNPLHYRDPRAGSACAVLARTTDWNTARQLLYELQSTLSQSLPFIPLYSVAVHDVYRGMAYPFDRVPGGLSRVYGAPALALP